MEKFKCERLSADICNKERIQSFRCERNINLEEYLLEEAWEEDESGRNAIYIILDKNHDDDVVMYFGLKCGMISCPFATDIYKLLDANNDTLLFNMPDDKLEALFYIKEFIDKADRESEINKVAETLSGIELSHFCVNSHYKRLRRNEGIDTSGMGEYFFYKEIYPIVELVRTYIGCKFLYLFAADGSDTQSLVRYYEDVLGFMNLNDYDKSLTDDREVVPIMPYYDYQCKFMLMPLS